MSAGYANLNSSHRDPVISHSDGQTPYGALNMLGNVWEWVDKPETPSEDQYANLWKQTWGRQLQPPLSRDEPYRQIKGGCFLFLSTSKLADLPSLVYDSAVLPIRVGRPEVGFRCARDVAP
jgi:formylglycine-generating enzyme required for sulfatase activity